MLYCRSCGIAYPDGDRCPDCGADLLPAEQELVAVLNTSDSALLPVLKSVLDAAEIPYVVQGDQAMGLFPLGSFGGGLFRRVLGASILVPREREQEARELLESYEDA
jgi:hypothetical protein